MRSLELKNLGVSSTGVTYAWKVEGKRYGIKIEYLKGYGIETIEQAEGAVIIFDQSKEMFSSFRGARYINPDAIEDIKTSKVDIQKLKDEWEESLRYENDNFVQQELKQAEKVEIEVTNDLGSVSHAKSDPVKENGFKQEVKINDEIDLDFDDEYDETDDEEQEEMLSDINSGKYVSSINWDEIYANVEERTVTEDTHKISDVEKMMRRSTKLKPIKYQNGALNKFDYSYSVLKKLAGPELDYFIMGNIDKLVIKRPNKIQFSKEALEAVNENPELIIREVKEKSLDIFCTKTDVSSFLSGKMLLVDFQNGIQRRMNAEFVKLEDLYKKAEKIKHETGLWPLSVAWPYLEGKTKKGTIMHAPLGYRSLQIEESLNKFTLTLDPNFSVNTYPILKRYTEVDGVVNQIDDSVSSLTDLLKHFYEHGINITQPLNDDFVDYVNIRKEMDSVRIKSIPNNFFRLSNEVVFTIKPSDEFIFYDLQKIANDNDEFQIPESNMVFGEESEPLRDMDFIVDVDSSKATAVNKAIESSVVIFGPPGTGKSETITAIMGKIISDCASAIFVSEKATAIEVIENNLKKIKMDNFVLNLNNPSKQYLIDKFNKQLNLINHYKATEIQELPVSNFSDDFTKSKSKVTRTEFYNSIRNDYEFGQFFKVYELIKELNETTKSVNWNKNLHENINNVLKTISVNEKANETASTIEKLQSEIDVATSKMSELESMIEIHNKKLIANISDLTIVQKKLTIKDIQQLIDLINENDIFNIYEMISFGEAFSWETYYETNEEIIGDLTNELSEFASNYISLNKKIDAIITSFPVVAKYKDADITRIINDLKYSSDLEVMPMDEKQIVSISKELSNTTLEQFADYILAKRKKIGFKKFVSQNKVEIRKIKAMMEIAAIKDELNSMCSEVMYEMTRYSFLENRIKDVQQLIQLNNMANNRQQFVCFLAEENQFDYSGWIANNNVEFTQFKKYIKTWEEVLFDIDEEVEEWNDSKVQNEKEIHELDSALKEFMKGLVKMDVSYWENRTDELKEVLELDEEKWNSYIKFQSELDSSLQSQWEKHIHSRKSHISEIRDVVINNYVLRAKALLSENTSSIMALRRFINGRFDKRTNNTVKLFKDEKAMNILKVIFPGVMMNPDIVSKTLPPEAGLFDYAIFDEASQIRLHRAIPTVHRAKTVIVSGDDKQLGPTDLYANIDRDEDDEMNLEEEHSFNEKTLLDFAKGKYHNIKLQVHYRSKAKELIQFSNQQFYKNSMNVADSPLSKFDGQSGIIVEEINGSWEVERTNIPEAERTCELFYHYRDMKKSVGIITFNDPQKKLIAQLIMDDPRYFENNDLYSFDKNLDELFIKSIKDVQGDERDIIIFSIAYGKSVASNRYVSHFGQFSKEKINVAITRAKLRMHVVKSMPSSEVQATTDDKRVFKDWLSFLEEHSAQESKKDFSNYENKFRSPFEEDYFKTLNNNIPEHLIALANYPVGLKEIDIVIYDTLKNQFIAAIELDGLKYHSTPEQITSDYERQIYLENMGWKFRRTTPFEFYRNRNMRVKQDLEFFNI